MILKYSELEVSDSFLLSPLLVNTMLKKELDLSELRFKDLIKKSQKEYQNLGDNQILELEKNSSYNAKNTEEG